MLSTIIGYVVSAVLGWLLHKFQIWFQLDQAKKADEKKISDAAQKLIDAKTNQERIDAEKNIINNGT